MYKRLSVALALLGLALGAASPTVGAKQPAEKAKGPAAKNAGPGYLGLLVEATPSGAKVEGVIVQKVVQESPAARAGFQTGDVITRVGKKEVRDDEELEDLLATHKAGEQLTFHVMRGGKDRDVQVTLGERPAPAAEAKRESPEKGPAPAAGPPRGRPAQLGVSVLPLRPEVRERFGVQADKGVLVAQVSPGTPAAKAGLKAGDVIVRLDGQAVNDPPQLRAIVQQAGVNKKVDVVVQRDGEQKTLTARLAEVSAGEPQIGVPDRRLPKGFPGARGLPSGSQQRLSELQRRVDELEKRVRQLEEKSGKAPR
jgi:serine protease Do